MDAYQASRCVRLWKWEPDEGRALEVLLAPAIDDAFIRTAGIRQHLLDLTPQLAPAQQQAAMALIARLGTPPARPIDSDPLRWPHLAKLGIQLSPDSTDSSLLDAIEARLADRDAERTWDSDPALDRMLEAIRRELSSCEDFRGDVAEQFSDLVLRTLRFLRSRQQAGPSSFGGRARYLFAWGKDEKPPLEDVLATDYFQFLEATGSGGGLHSEVRDLGGGRVDVLVHYGTHLFTAELKREFDDASRDSLRSYLGQAGSYQGTGVRLGLLLVLDLTPKPSYPGHLSRNAWVEVLPPVVPDDLHRFVVVVRIPANRRVPSDMANPFSQK
jgi:hypothetical protein